MSKHEPVTFQATSITFGPLSSSPVLLSAIPCSPSPLLSNSPATCRTTICQGLTANTLGWDFIPCPPTILVSPDLLLDLLLLPTYLNPSPEPASISLGALPLGEDPRSPLIFPCCPFLIAHLDSSETPTDKQNSSLPGTPQAPHLIETQGPHSCHTWLEPRMDKDKQRVEHPPNKSETRLSTPRNTSNVAPNAQIPVQNFNKKSQDNTPPPEARTPIATCPGKGNGAEAQDKDFNIVIMNTFKDLKGDLNKCLNEDRESTIVKGNNENNPRHESRI